MLKIRVVFRFPVDCSLKKMSKQKMDIYLSLSGSKEAVLSEIIY